MDSGIRMPVTELAPLLGGRLHPAGAALDGVIDGVSSDSRTLTRGALFIALRGPRFDGHEHLATAADAGAAAALVDHGLDHSLPQVVVDDTRLALGRLAAAWRRRCAVPTVAVTGSNGKTTVKEMLAAILSRRGPTLATQGNLNNDIGLPLTLLRLTPEHRYAVAEMGANHPGEIAYLSDIAAPDVALVNNAGPAHLEGFGDVAGVALAKGEIFNGLTADGIAVFNGDDAHAGTWRALANAGAHRCIEFGLGASAEVTATAIDGSRWVLETPLGRIDVRLPLAGRHNLMNALAAAAVATALDIPLADIAAGLEAVAPVRGRLNPRPARAGATVLDDSYNANPASLDAALQVLADRPGRHILVLGDLGELGPESEAIHADIGARAREQGVDALYACGELSRRSALAFGRGGHHYAEVAALLRALEAELAAGVSVLVKGSRSAGMERVADALVVAPTKIATATAEHELED